ncbi:MAG: hypothetical protein P8I83_04450 [Paracoccaceae bacterium]|nr:hypothetical protein [Paracoccaceae bacterium]
MPGVAGLNWKGYEMTVASVNKFGCGDIFAPARDLAPCSVQIGWSLSQNALRLCARNYPRC